MAADPSVFEPDGSADTEAIIRVADRENRFVEITVHALTGAITNSSAKNIADLPGAHAVAGRNQSPRGGFRGPSRSREFQQSGGMP